MAYEKQNWKNLPSKETPVNAERLNHIEEGIYDNSVGKQEELVSGENIKTINGQSILGSGNIVIEGGSGGTTDYNDLTNKPQINSVALSGNKTSSDLGLQPTLVSGTNIKTINSMSLLGSGDIEIEGGGAAPEVVDETLQFTGSGGGGGGTSELSTEVKNAILDCFENIAWTSANGQQYYDTLSDLFFPPKALVSISAVFTQGSAVIYSTDTLDSLKQYLTVTATYDDSTTETVTNYTLSGTLTVGTSTITASYGGKTDTFDVVVSQPVELSSITAVYTQSGAVYTTDTLDSLKNDLVVTANYTDSSTRTVTDYTLSGTLTAGTSTITVAYQGKTTTFNVTVTAVALTSIDAVFTQGSATITVNNSLDDLKQYLVVTANYNNGTTSTVASTDYTLSGTLTAGTSTITVTYEGKTDTFDVTVTSSEWDYEWFYNSQHNTPQGMTSNDFQWNDTNGYLDAKSPTLAVPNGDVEVEIECAWLHATTPGTKTNTQLVVTSGKSGDNNLSAKIYNKASATEVVFISSTTSGGSSGTSYSLGNIGDAFHKYKLKLTGTGAECYLDDALKSTGYTYPSQYNGAGVIYSADATINNYLAIKSIKYKTPSTPEPEPAPEGGQIDGTDLTWETGFINSSGEIDKTQATTTNSGSWTSSYYSVQGYNTALVALAGSTLQRNAYYDANKTFISRALTAESEIPSNAVYARATIHKSELGHTSYDGTGATITLS